MLNKISASKKLHVSGCTAKAIVLACVLWSCNPEKQKQRADGEQLAKKSCSSCHSFPDPDLLDKITWKTGVLPNMALRMGIGRKTSGVLTKEEWALIQDYYQQQAPERLKTASVADTIVQDWALFRPEKPATQTDRISFTTLASFDPRNGTVITRDANTFKATWWNNRLQPQYSRIVGSPPSDVYFPPGDKRSVVLTTLGTLSANDVAEGKVLRISTDSDARHRADTIAAKLPRPVQCIPADINHDGITDWIVCAFGHDRGALLAYLTQKDGAYLRQTITSAPGAIQTIAGDFNNDGWTDLMTLFSAADECIKLFINDRKGGFSITQLLSFPAVYGSGSFQLADFNNDGLDDILYSCGDNNDYSPVLKPYHGIYIYLNKGRNQYTKAYFYPINGCTKAIASDFDLDGDLDIAVIAFYADLRQKGAKTFLYFEQDKQLHFLPHQPPVSAYGRWLCMDVKDYDNDGDPDILLGNFAAKFNNEKNVIVSWDQHLPFIILRNQTKNR